jgi:hypothetical protein
MKVLPRKLVLLVIDDELSISPRGYRVPASIRLWSPGDDLRGIDSWHTALRFWSSFRGGEVPDLVVADVRFIQDRTTPLSMLFKPQENNIPTGLSHLKTFAVLSRALGLPLGVGARTMDPTLWAEQIAAPEPEKRAMGYLAVHEIGELAAILGDGDEILNGGADKQQHISNCLRWLKVNSATEFEDGLRKAVRDYRRRLFKLLTAPEVPSVFVRPGHYAELLGWCRRMKENPRPLDAENDIGLELTYHDGRRDLISLTSLFADFDKIATKALNPSSFSDDSQVVAEPWKLDDDGRPRIGAFLQRLGSLKTAYDYAAKAVKAYQVTFPPPKNYRPPSLAKIKNGDGYTPLAAGLTVLFQFVLIEQKRVAQWEHSFENDSWNHRKLLFTSGKIAPSDSLKRRLLKLVDLIRRYILSGISDEEGGLFTRADLFDEFPTEWFEDLSKERPEEINVDRGDHNREWVKWHFDRLVDIGVLEYKVVAGEDCYKLNPSWLKGRPELPPPPAPRKFPRVVDIAQKVKPSQAEPSRIKWLRSSLGYKSNDYNSVERVLGDAFGGGSGVKKSPEQEIEKAAVKAKAGRAILNSLEDLDLPFFLLEICREYAADYLKWPRSKWPEWLRSPLD